MKCDELEDEGESEDGGEPDYDSPTEAERHELAHAERRALRGY